MEYSPALNLKELYPESYFALRQSNDQRRLAQFNSEGAFIRKHCKEGKTLDVGCSTGEFLQAINWQGERYGMEISDFARLAAEKIGFNFAQNLFTQTDFFDLIIFRGTIQHLDEPFRYMKYANRALKHGGHIAFLATPNLNSPVYRLKKRLPFIQKEYNYYLPDDINLPNALKNFGFELCEIRYPYWDSPYRNLVRDHYLFMRNVFSRRYFPHAFWKSSMEIIARKVRAV